MRLLAHLASVDSVGRATAIKVILNTECINFCLGVLCGSLVGRFGDMDFVLRAWKLVRCGQALCPCADANVPDVLIHDAGMEGPL